MSNERLILYELTSSAKRDLLRYPLLSPGEMLKRQLKNVMMILMKQKPTKTDRYSWPNGMLAMALYSPDSDDYAGNARAIKIYLDRWISLGQTIYSVDNLMNGMSLLSLLEHTADKKFETALTKMTDYVLTIKKSSEGTIPYRQMNTEAIYVDTIGILCPFLFRLARYHKNDAILELATKQIRCFINHGIDKVTGLPVHGYLADSKMKLGIVGWGRGVGWYLCGLADSLDYIDKGSGIYQLFSEELRIRLMIVLKYQYPDGYFCWQLGLDRGQNDISATSMILYAAVKALEQGLFTIDELSSYLYRGLNAVKASYQDKQMKHCSAECGGFSIYPQNYGSYPWGTAPTIAFLTKMEKIKS